MEEIKKKAHDIIVEMYENGMNVDEVIELLSSIAAKEDFKIFSERRKQHD